MNQTRKEDIFSVSSLSIAVLAWSAFPFLLGIADTTKYKTSLLHFVLAVCLCLGLIATGWIFYRKEYQKTQFWDAVKSCSIFSKTAFPKLRERLFFAITIASCCNLALAFIISKYVGGIVAGVGYETWVIWFVMMRCARKHNGKHFYLAGFCLLSLIGVGLVYVGQTGTWSFGSITAVFLSIMSGFFSAMVMEGSMRWAEKAAKEYGNEATSDTCIAYSIIACLAITSIATFGGFIWLLSDGGIGNTSIAGIGLITILGISTGVASAAVRMGNKYERHLPLNVGLSLQIPLGILWIWMFLSSVIVSVWVFAAGILLIIAAATSARVVDVKISQKAARNSNVLRKTY